MVSSAALGSIPWEKLRCCPWKSGFGFKAAVGEISTSGVPFGLYKPPTTSPLVLCRFPSSAFTTANEFGEVAVAIVDLSVIGDNTAAGILIKGVEVGFLSPRGTLVGQGGTCVTGSISAGLGISVFLVTFSRDEIGFHPACC